jgi:hypothetical protein
MWVFSGNNCIIENINFKEEYFNAKEISESIFSKAYDRERKILKVSHFEHITLAFFLNLKECETGTANKIEILKNEIYRWINKPNKLDNMDRMERTCIFLTIDSNTEPTERLTARNKANLYVHEMSCITGLSIEAGVFTFLIENRLLDMSIEIYLKGAIKFLYILSMAREESDLILKLKELNGIIYSLTEFGNNEVEKNKLRREEERLKAILGNEEEDIRVVNDKINNKLEEKYIDICRSAGWSLIDDSLAKEFSNSFPLRNEYFKYEIEFFRNKCYKLDFSTYGYKLKLRLDKDLNYILSKYEKRFDELNNGDLENILLSVPIKYKRNFTFSNLSLYKEGSGFIPDIAELKDYIGQSKDDILKEMRSFIEKYVKNVIKEKNYREKYIEKLEQLLKTYRAKIEEDFILSENIKNYLYLSGANIVSEQDFLDNAHKMIIKRRPFVLTGRENIYILFASEQVVQKINNKLSDLRLSIDFTHDNSSAPLNLYYTKSFGGAKEDMQLFFLVPCYANDFEDDSLSNVMFQIRENGER